MKKLLLLGTVLALASCGPMKAPQYVTDVQAHRGGMGLYPEESLEL